MRFFFLSVYYFENRGMRYQRLVYFQSFLLIHLMIAAKSCSDKVLIFPVCIIAFWSKYTCVRSRAETIRIYHHFVQEQWNHLSVKDLQSRTRLTESRTLQIFDGRVDFPVPVQSRGWLFFSFNLSIPIANPHFAVKTALQNVLLFKSGADLG